MNRELRDFLIFIASEKGLAKNTVDAYQRDIKSLSLFLNIGEGDSFSAINEASIVSYLSHLKSQEYASSSLSRVLIAIKVFFRFLKREGYLSENAAQYLVSPKLWQLIPEVLSEEEIERLLAQPDIHTEKGARDNAVLEVLYASGLRVSEVCQLKLYDIDEVCLKILGKGGKERVVPIGKKALKSLDRYAHYRDLHESDKVKNLFVTEKGKPITRQGVWQMIKFYAKLAGIKKNVSPHTMRHSFATHLLDNGADLRVIQEMMGHASINSTDRYTHISRSRLQASFDQFHPKP